MVILEPKMIECDAVDIYIDGKRAIRSNWGLYMPIFHTVVDGNVIAKYFNDKVDLDHVIKAIAVKDGNKEVLFEKELSYETMKWLYEMRIKEKLYQNTTYGIMSM